MQALPVAGTLTCAFLLAWREHGSIAAGSWLPYALVVTGLAAAAAAAGSVARPRVAVLAGPAALLALALWATLTLLWSPLPAAARDEGLLTAVYALALLLPAATLTSAERRIAGTAALVAGCGGVALATAAALAFGADPGSRFVEGRLAFPITYTNADGAIFALAVWPGIALAARRSASTPARALALGGASAAAAASLLAQSKGSVLALAVSLVVVLAVAPGRLRLLGAAALALVGPAIAFLPLTAPYRAEGPGPIRHAGIAVLAVAAATVAAGLVYAALDARVEVGPRARRIAGALMAALLLAAVGAGAAAFFTSVDDPAGWASQRWADFKHSDRTPGESTHLLSLGSNRYDFWRVSLDEWTRHPLTGVGARGFGPDYLIHKRSYETPARAHSLPLQALGEQGAVGFALLALGLGVPFALVVRGVRRRRATAAAALGAGTAWLVQASVDWTWSFPAVTLPALVALGVGMARDETRPLAPARSRALAAAVAVVAVLALVPPWLAARYTQRGIADGSTADLARAHRLDPLSTAPLLAAARVEPLPQAIPELREAARREPRAVANRYILGVAYLQAGRPAAARRELEAAIRLKPGDPWIERALRQAR